MDPQSALGQNSELGKGDVKGPAHPLDVLENPDGYHRHFMDVVLWRPFVEEVCRRHGLAYRSVRPGMAGTFPTFIADERWVIKFFGRLFDGETCWQVEAEAAELIAGVPEIPVARELASCVLEAAQGWRYLVFDFMPGVSIGEVYAQVTFEDRLALARWLGESLRRIYALEIPDETVLPRLTDEKLRGWAANRRREGWRGWPVHLAAQVDDYLASTAAFVGGSATHFIHADLTCDHILGRLENGHWTTLAVIDFGDAMLGNIFYELAALHLDLFDCDKHLLIAFLDAYDLSAQDRENFTCKAMATAMLHQFDVFGPLFEWKPELRQVHTLEELADRLWNVNNTPPA